MIGTGLWLAHRPELTDFRARWTETAVDNEPSPVVSRCNCTATVIALHLAGAGGAPFIGGIVAACDLSAADASTTLDAIVAASPRVCSCRGGGVR